MNEKDRVYAAAQLIVDHYPRGDRKTCTCKESWSPLHVAMALNDAGLLCALVKVAPFDDGFGNEPGPIEDVVVNLP
jgi:hypothetical protein